MPRLISIPPGLLLLTSLLLQLPAPSQSVPRPSVPAEPWQVGVAHRVLGLRLCGGSLLNRRFVLTAAHCLRGVARPQELEVVLRDDLGLRRVEATEQPRSAAAEAASPRLFYAARPNTYKVSVSKVIIHPDFDPATLESDLALIQLEEDLDLAHLDGVEPICLPDRQEGDFVGAAASQSGWGALPLFSGPNPSLLAPRNLDILPPEQCPLPVTDKQICAINRFFVYRTCHADPGGSLSTNYNDQKILIGVVSSKNICPIQAFGFGNPGIFTSVAAHLDWIAKSTAGVLTCIPYRT